MAQSKNKKDNKKEEPAAKGSKKVDAKSAGKDDAAKAAKKAERLARLKDREPGQRPNSRQIDVIATATGTIETFGYPVRKTGTLVTTIAKDAKGNVIAVASTFVGGVKVKVKKEHGILQPGVAGTGKKGKGEEGEEGEED